MTVTTRRQTVEPVFMSPQEAAVYAGCSVDTIRRRISDGSLPASRLGKRLIRLDKNDLDKLFRPIPSARTTY
ncbi:MULTISPECIES: excisionase family DNA-binding protein [unclassified Luteococcus]|uniref:excisionase family DNA-binding protein n=1 Tax=unclassified Luteococcus TaxID=2639923 RepID=UPI00313B32DC